MNTGGSRTACASNCNIRYQVSGLTSQGVYTVLTLRPHSRFAVSSNGRN
jgi:hypothetical protein